MKGFTAITTVLILGAVVVSIAATVTLLSIGEAQSSLSLFKGEENLSFVEGCVEDYLLKIRANPGFAGGDIIHPEATCTISIISGNPNWRIVVSSLNTPYKRQIEVIFVRNPTGIALTGWKEI